MPRVTAAEMSRAGNTPLDVYDGNGELILLPIVAFDAQTGVVEWNALDKRGKPVVSKGSILRRAKRFTAPLMWKKIPHALGIVRERQIQQIAIDSGGI